LRSPGTTSWLDIRPLETHHAMESRLDMATTINNRVRELRSDRGWTQQQLADAVGVSRQSINSIECNRYVPSLPLALTFARIFGCSTDDIFTMETGK
jgi:putative transcriptional regulator